MELGIFLSGNSPVIDGNVVNGNILLESNGSAVISNNTIIAGTERYSATQGIMLYGEGTLVLNNTVSGAIIGVIPNENSIVENNTFFNVNTGIEVSAYNTSIIGNTIHDASYGIEVENTSGTIIQGNTIFYNLYGIFSYSENVTFTDNYLTHNYRIGIQIVAPYPILQGNMIIQGNTVTNCSDGMDIGLTYGGDAHPRKPDWELFQNSFKHNRGNRNRKRGK